MLVHPLLLAFSMVAVVAIVMGGCAREVPLAVDPSLPLDEALAAWQQELGVPGMAVGVYYGDAVQLQRGFGVADRATGRPVEATTPFCVGSIAKLFVGTAALRLATRGVLALDAPLATWRPDVPGADRATLQMLGTHQAGYRNYITLPAVKDTFSAAPERLWTRAELLALSLAAEPHFGPGAGWVYSNANALLLVEALERATALPWDSLLAREVLRPAGLAATTRVAEGCTAMAPGAARGYQLGDAEGPTPWTVAGDSLHDVSGDALSKWDASGDLRSTVPDLRRFLDAAFRGDVLSPEARARRGATVATGEADYRYGFALEVWDAGPAQTLGHCGVVPGYNACLSYRPHDDVAVVVLTNVYGTQRSAMPARALTEALLVWTTAQASAAQATHTEPPGWSTEPDAEVRARAGYMSRVG
ncbi:MAG: serine hydrolase domain-containing protein [Bacteroidota bacterium]